ncbi:hypothetical protein GOP47_0006848 [Adiantum capillus-veneris]|uniref:Pentatricopeptide repeat-containing protein n=1 Tax=Adiantum capillus-veneris TaxID=13818 RepID=A0A9D4ZMG1_ADICA|nr:hypothetical protein GOP47_0006848 [Adiantum capillus-veneris]
MGQTDDAVLLETLKLCTKAKDLTWGKRIHAYLVISKIKIPVFFLNIITDMYGKCGSLVDARALFYGIHKQDVVSWNVMMSSYARHGFPETAIELFRQMGSVGRLPDNITFVGLLDACATIGDLRLGAQAHINLAFSGLKLTNTTANALINMYSKCRNMDLACEVFEKMDDRDVVSWNTILSGYCINTEAGKVLEVFKEMEQTAVEADCISYLCVLNACALLSDIALAKDVHARIKQAGIKSDVVLENALLHMYSKCGSIDIALQIFNEMSFRNVISWTVIIASHSNEGDLENAIFSFHQMQCEGVNPNDVTILSILHACSSSRELKRGKQIHASIVGRELQEEAHVGNAVVDMYSKCGSLLDASKCFYNMRTHDTVSWNTIVSSYAKHGHGKDALKLVQQMKEEGFKLDSVTLASILSACSCAGLIVEAYSCLKSVEKENGLVPNSSHYACVVDLLARAGLLETADEFYTHIPDEPNLASWRSLLGACKIHGDPKRAKAVANAMLNSQSTNFQVLDTISNMHFFLAGNTLNR